MKSKLIVSLIFYSSVITYNANAQNNAPFQKSTLITDSIDSNILKEKIAFSILLPESYNINKQKEYPVLYLLHGLMGTNEDWTKFGNLKRVVDKLVDSGEISEMIIVMPSAGGNIYQNVWNGYFNMPGWNYEDYFFTEFMPQIETKYRIKKNKKHRGIAGLSMGGGGSTVYAQRHPDIFSSCYAMSALMSLPDNGGLPSNGLKKIDYLNQSVKDLSAVKFIETATPETINNLKETKWFIDCGDDDFLFDTNIDFFKAMRNKGIPCQLRVKDGVHDWEYWNTSLYTALPFFTRVFNSED